MNNPDSRTPALRWTPSPLQSPSPTAPPDITRHTESSRAKTRSREKANISLEKLFDKILEEQIDYCFNSAELDEPNNLIP
ncbi:hypothetical protein CVT26_001232 [Gymnopilus dilepis]|uniref:Uncharacterized protein n=1 Tax=Gymnopilus dilepis TaxID=231916 RepID=A0A409YLL9_9AGAR|nr:hypothetical protein CVT26_001232 [Gymnopilus dilepis]